MVDNEGIRLGAVREFLKIDFDKIADFRNIVEIAAHLCDKPVALITLLDERVNWVKVRYGIEEEYGPRDISFCQYGIQQDDLFIVEDATKDSRFDENPLVHSEPNVRFYAGAPLTLNSGLRIGTLCLFDVKPNSINALQQKTLVMLAQQVTSRMELELSRLLLQMQVEKVEAQNKSLRKIAHLQSHDIRQPLASIMGLVNLVKEGLHTIDEGWIELLDDAAGTLDRQIRSIVQETNVANDLKLLWFSKMVEEIEDYAILLLDENGNIENWNKGAERMMGYKAAEIVGKNISVFYTEEDRVTGLPQQLVAKAIKTGVAKGEGWRVRKGGSKLWCGVTITAIHNNEGEIVGFTRVSKDLTAIRGISPEATGI